MSKVRRVDFHPAEYMAGTSKLSLEERGAYWSVCALIYDHGAPVENDDRWIAAAIFVDVRTWKRIKSNLIAKGKLHFNDGKLSNGRCETEIKRALARINGAKKGAQARWDQSDQPPRDVPEMSPDVQVDPPHVAVQVPTNIDTPVSCDDNGLADAAAYAAPYANQEPRTTKAKEEEESPPDNGGKSYGYNGRIIKFSVPDYEERQERFRETIPDLRAQLDNEDEYYDRTLTGEGRKKWFWRLDQKLNNLHQKILRERRQPNSAASLNDSW